MCNSHTTASQENIGCPWGKATDYWMNDAPLANCSVDADDRQPCPQWQVEVKASNASHASAICADTATTRAAAAAFGVTNSSAYANCAFDSTPGAPHGGCFQCKPKRYTGFDLPRRAVELIDEHDPTCVRSPVCLASVLVAHMCTR